MEHFTKLYSKVRLLALPANIGLGLKLLGVINTLAYYKKLSTGVKIFFSTNPRNFANPISK